MFDGLKTLGLYLGVSGNVDPVPVLPLPQRPRFHARVHGAERVDGPGWDPLPIGGHRQPSLQSSGRYALARQALHTPPSLSGTLPTLWPNLIA